MKYSLVEHARDNTVKLTEERCWAKFVDFICSGRVETTDKESVPMVIGAEFKSLDEYYEPARNKEGNLKYRKDGKPHIRRCKANLKLIYMLPVDIDGTMTIERARNRFRHYEYVAYTSFSHKSERKQFKDCFRLFFPFEEPLTPTEFSRRAASFTKWIGKGVFDGRSVDLARGFFVPSHPPGTEHLHCAWYNKGEWLCKEVFEEVIEETYTPKPLSNITKLNHVSNTGKILWDTLDVVSLFKAAGLYIKHDSGNRHLVKCPFHYYGEKQHSANIDGGVCIYERDTLGQHGFSCLHESHKDKHLKDACEIIRKIIGNDVYFSFFEREATDNDIIRDKLIGALNERLSTNN